MRVSLFCAIYPLLIRNADFILHSISLMSSSSSARPTISYLISSSFSSASAILLLSISISDFFFSNDLLHPSSFVLTFSYVTLPGCDNRLSIFAMRFFATNDVHVLLLSFFIVFQPLPFLQFLGQGTMLKILSRNVSEKKSQKVYLELNCPSEEVPLKSILPIARCFYTCTSPCVTIFINVNSDNTIKIIILVPSTCYFFNLRLPTAYFEKFTSRC